MSVSIIMISCIQHFVLPHARYPGITAKNLYHMEHKTQTLVQIN